MDGTESFYALKLRIGLVEPFVIEQRKTRQNHKTGEHDGKHPFRSQNSQAQSRNPIELGIT